MGCNVWASFFDIINLLKERKKHIGRCWHVWSLHALSNHSSHDQGKLHLIEICTEIWTREYLRGSRESYLLCSLFEYSVHLGFGGLFIASCKYFSFVSVVSDPPSTARCQSGSNRIRRWKFDSLNVSLRLQYGIQISSCCSFIANSSMFSFVAMSWNSCNFNNWSTSTEIGELGAGHRTI